MKILAAIVLLVSMTGCGMVLGLKEIKTAGGTDIRFNSGFGGEANFTESDGLSNTRSIKP